MGERGIGQTQGGNNFKPLASILSRKPCKVNNGMHLFNYLNHWTLKIINFIDPPRATAGNLVSGDRP